MGFETSAFGAGDGSNVTGDVNNHYGQRDIGGTSGVSKQTGYYEEYTINVDSEGLDATLPITVGAIVTEVISDFATGAITTLTVGGVDISGADGTSLNNVELAASNTGAVVLAGPTAGNVVIRYLKAPV